MHLFFQKAHESSWLLQRMPLLSCLTPRKLQLSCCHKPGKPKLASKAYCKIWGES